MPRMPRQSAQGCLGSVQKTRGGKLGVRAKEEHVDTHVGSTGLPSFSKATLNV